MFQPTDPRIGRKLKGADESYRFSQAWRAAEAAGLTLPCTKGGDFWLSDDQVDRLHAVELCRPCPIKRECLNSALARGEHFGVWSLDLTDAASGTWMGRKKAA